eukprot:s1349_g6.t1
MTTLAYHANKLKDVEWFSLQCRSLHASRVTLFKAFSVTRCFGPQAMGNAPPVPMRCRTPECNRGCDAADCVQEMMEKDQSPCYELELLRAVRNGNLEGDVNVRQPLKLITIDRYQSGEPIHNCGLTPLMYAASNGKASVIRALLSAGARVDDTDERGVTALHLAAASGDINGFREIIDAKAKTNLITEEGETVLDFLPREVLEDRKSQGKVDKELHSQFKALLPDLDEVVKLCQVVGVFPGARMNDGTEEELDVDVEMLNWEDCAQHLTARVEKTWRQLFSQKYRSVLDLVSKKADHSVLRLLQISQQHIESQLDRVRQERELMKEVLERRAQAPQMTLPLKDPNTGMPLQGFPGWPPPFAGFAAPMALPPAEGNETAPKPPAKRLVGFSTPGAPQASNPQNGDWNNIRSYLQCICLIFLWSFKPSEPHLSAYLVEVKHFSKYQRDAEIYTVYSYGSLVVVTLCALVKVYTLRLPNFKGLGDKALILLGACARVATRVLLLYGTTLWQMQLMQVAFSVGLVGEFAFYAYCLKVIPGESQRLTALVQSSYLVSHTLAGLLGDWLLHHTDLGLVGLLWIAAVSVFLSCPVACSLKEVDELDRPAVSPKVLWGVYSSPRYFWLSTLWWVLSYPAYQTIYGYESSLYANRFGDAAIDPRPSSECGVIQWECGMFSHMFSAEPALYFDESH